MTELSKYLSKQVKIDNYIGIVFGICNYKICAGCRKVWIGFIDRPQLTAIQIYKSGLSGIDFNNHLFKKINFYTSSKVDSIILI